MSSCSQDKSVDIYKGHAIDFRTSLTPLRAAETTTDNLDKIFVTAINKNNENYFSNTEFTKQNSFFTSTPVYFWPGDGSELSFYAYAPSTTDLGGTITIDQTEKKLKGYSPATEIAQQKDFLTAHAKGSKANESTGVELPFKHQLSQIEIKAKNGNEGYSYMIQGVRIAQVKSKGTFDFGTSQWTLENENSTYKTEYTPAITLKGDAESLMGAGGNAMLLPQQLTKWDSETDKTNTKKGAYLAVKIKITTKDGAKVYPVDGAEEYAWSAVAIDTHWEAGKKYIYTLDFSGGAGRVDPEKTGTTNDIFKAGDKILGGAIKFTVAVEQWQDATESTTDAHQINM